MQYFIDTKIRDGLKKEEEKINSSYCVEVT